MVTEFIIISSLVLLLAGVWFKWKKLLLSILLLEGSSILAMTALLEGTVMSSMTLTVFVFFVSEALVLLSSAIGNVSSIGLSYGALSY